jgi:hypothetical protein
MTIPNFGMVVPTDEMTVEFWQRFEQADTYIPTTFGLEPEDTTNRFKLNSPWNSYDYLFFGFGATTYGIQNVNTYSTWHHIAGVCSKSQNSMSVYLDGNLIGTNAGMTPFVHYAADLQIPNAGFQPFAGAVDEFRIWNVARTADQIKAHYKKNLRGNEPGLFAYWNFNNGDGTSGVVPDLSPNGYNGTLSANPPAAFQVSDAPLQQGIADAQGNILDGDGDGFAGGDFISEFTIAVPLRISAPTPGSLLYTAQSTPITWINDGVSGTVDLSLSTDNGVTFGAPVATVPASQLTYSWTVPNVSSLQCAVRVSSSSDPTVFAVSGTFAIAPQPPYLQSVAPAGASQASNVKLTIAGSNLPAYSGPTGAASPVAIALVNGTSTLYVSGTLTSSATSIQCTVDLTGTPLGLYDVELLEDGTVAATLPTSFTVRALPPYITDTNGIALDGEYNGPNVLSGNGVPGGNYVATFTISTPKLTVTQLTPTPGTTLTVPPTSIVANFSKNLDPSTVNANTVLLTRAGPDGVLGTGDDVTIAPASITVVGNNSLNIDLTGVILPDDTYQVRLLGGATLGITDSMGNLLDGDNDGTAGGDYVATVAVFASLPNPPVEMAGSMSVAKLSGSVSFSRSSKDSIFIQGAIPGLDSSFKPSGAILTVNAEGAVVSFTLDGKGHSKNNNGTLKLLLKPKPAKTKTPGLPFSLKLMNGSWASLWNMAPGGRPSPRNMVVIISLNGKEYSATVTVTYSPGSKSGRFKK